MTDDELTLVANDLFIELDGREAEDERASRYRQWALAVFCWDGLLPITVLIVPRIVNFLFPRWEALLAIVSIFGPMIAFSIRFFIGWIRMRTGRSYVWQTIVFVIAISLLFLFETILLVDQFGRGPKIATPSGLLAIYLWYVAAMAIAMFPARMQLTVKRQ